MKNVSSIIDLARKKTNPVDRAVGADDYKLEHIDIFFLEEISEDFHDNIVRVILDQTYRSER